MSSYGPNSWTWDGRAWDGRGHYQPQDIMLVDARRGYDEPDNQHLLSTMATGKRAPRASPYNSDFNREPSPGFAPDSPFSPYTGKGAPAYDSGIFHTADFGAPPQRPSSWWRPPLPPRFSGWRFGALNCSLSVFVVLLINVILTVWLAASKGFEDGEGTIYEGDCSVVRRMNIGIHLLINLFSTILLSGSNYCMQCLSAPTRQEIDREHAKGGWLDVGVHSFKNIFHINWKRAVLWCLLGFSSLPLHLFYNSVAHASISANDYKIISVNEAFTDPNQLDHSVKIVDTNTWSSEYRDPAFLQLIRTLHVEATAASSSMLEKLDNTACIQAYAQDYISLRSNVLIVSSNDNSSSTPTLFESRDIIINDEAFSSCQDPYKWICPNADCNRPCSSLVGDVTDAASTWAPLEKQTLYCLSQRTAEHCKFLFSLPIIGVVIVFNVVKAVLMAWLVFGMKDRTLMTVGDAVLSFLGSPDRPTRNRCLFGKREFRARKGPGPAMAKQWHRERRFWLAATSPGRVWMFSVMLLIALSTCAGLLAYGVSTIKVVNSSEIWALGLGSINVKTLIQGWGIPGVGAGGLVSNVLIANLPQPLLSIIYFTFNAVFTSMLLGREWSRFALRRKGLRLSSPLFVTPGYTGSRGGASRTTYFLQLPYRYALPIMTVSAVLHWLVSQSIFLVAIDRYDWKEQPVYRSIGGGHKTVKEFMTCGYSPVAILCVIMLGIGMVGALLAVGLRRFAPGIPLAGSCSAAIAVACHADAADDKTAMGEARLMWGVTGWNGEVGHCAFSAREVGFPQEGALYSGGTKEAVEDGS